jgi:hypothetical protein
MDMMSSRQALFAARAGLVGAAILGALVGCGGSGGATTSSSGSTSTSGGAGGGGGDAGSTTSSAGGAGGAATSAGSTGSTGGGAPVGCKALFCDDFEKDTAVDPAKWTVDVGYDPAITMSVESAMAAHGNNAAQAHLVDTTGGFASLKETVTFPQLADELWGRAYFFTTVASGAGHTGFISAYAGDQRVLEVGQSNGTWQLTYYEPGKEFPAGYAAMMPRHQWVCLEWHLARSGAHLIEVYVDGAVAVTYDTADHQPGAFTALGLGMDNHSANPPGNDAYFDDVAIDATRVGCIP